MKPPPPGLTLFLLAPVLGELVSGHQGPLEFLNPIALLVFSLPYGCGALICRELMVRWGKGWGSLLLLGLAYGIYEEAVVVRSLFNPQWEELGAMAEYGYAAGINWTWSFMVLHFHTVISIAASVMLAEILYPARRRGERWLNNWTFGLAALYLLLWTPLGWWMTDYRPPELHYVLSIAAIGALGAAAWRLPAPSITPALPQRKTPAAFWFFLIGCLNTPVIFIGIALSAEHGWPPLVVTLAALCAVDAMTLWLVWVLSGRGAGWEDRHRLALVAGLLAFFLFFGTAQDFEQFKGHSIVALLAVIGLWRIRRASRRVPASGSRATVPK
jgi:hypothetical protein